jgi:hypothetical protein
MGLEARGVRGDFRPVETSALAYIFLYQGSIRWLGLLPMEGKENSRGIPPTSPDLLRRFIIQQIGDIGKKNEPPLPLKGRLTLDS